jgi:hypothetical protein
MAAAGCAGAGDGDGATGGVAVELPLFLFPLLVIVEGCRTLLQGVP